MASSTDFAALVAHGNYTATLKVLDEALVSAELQQAALQAKLVQLHANRGFCHQRLGLNRKALKVGGACACLTHQRPLHPGATPRSCTATVLHAHTGLPTPAGL